MLFASTFTKGVVRVEFPKVLLALMSLIWFLRVLRRAPNCFPFIFLI